MAERTLEEVEEEYKAVRAAYLAALKAESVSISSGTHSRSLSRTSSTDLKKQMAELDRERKSLSRGGGLKVYGATPV